MLYELTDQVRQNLLVILKQATMTGEQWRVFAEIEQALNKPVSGEVAQEAQAKEE